MPHKKCTVYTGLPPDVAMSIVTSKETLIRARKTSESGWVMGVGGAGRVDLTVIERYASESVILGGSAEGYAQE